MKVEELEKLAGDIGLLIKIQVRETLDYVSLESL